MERDLKESNAAAQEELSQAEAVGVVAASARRLFSIVSDQQARELAALVLRDLEIRGIRLVRDPRSGDRFLAARDVPAGTADGT